MDMFRQTEPVLRNRDLFDRPAPIPEMRIRSLTPDFGSIQKRASSDDSGSKGSSGGSDATPIAIGVVVPVVIIAIIMFVIWRRRQRITKVEEANDKYKSLDFGVDESGIAHKKKNGPKGQAPEMSMADVRNTLRKDRGISVDLGTANPYLLPPEVQQSRESLHSLSRNLNNGDDKYRATTFVPDDGSVRSPSSLSRGDGSSTFTGSTRHRTGTMNSDSKTDLLPRLPPTREHSETPSVRRPLPAADRTQSGFLAPFPQGTDRNSTLSTGSNTAALRASNNYLGKFIKGGEKQQENKKDEQPGLIVSETEVQVTPPADEPRELPTAVVRNEPPNTKRSSSLYESKQTDHAIAELADTHNAMHYNTAPEPTIPVIETSSNEMDAASQSQFPQRTQSKRDPAKDNQQAFDANDKPPVPTVNVQHHQRQQPPAEYADDASDYYDDDVYDEYQDYVGYARGSMLGARPLPHDDPSENPEQRANRIRSFYKEYFDDSGKQGQANRQTNYYDGSEQYDDFDYGYYEHAHSRGPSIRSDTRHRAFSHGSHVYHSPGPRAQSTMSGQMGPRQRMPPKKKQPPPKPLMTLPTPHKLKDDDFLPNAIDFAPPQIFKNQRSGTPDSMRGGLRPYSPSVRPHVPLNSSFDDLASVPSPHALRKSSTFTALDFAPPRRFKEPGDSMSDAGSVRSGRSNISQMQLANIRNGAYRVSRIPKEVAGTRDDMFAALKPKWDMRGDGAATPTLR